MAITLFKVIQGHRFGYQSKAHMRVINTILTYLLVAPFPGWPIIGQLFASDRGVPHFNALAADDSMRISG